MAEKRKRKKSTEKFSLYHLQPDDVLRRLLSTKPSKKTKPSK